MISINWKKCVRYSHWRAICAAIMLFVALPTVSGPEASAKDLPLLTQYLVPIFLSQDLATACGAANPHFLRTLPRGANSVAEFAERMKKDITDNLPDDEAAIVVLAAANQALAAARFELHNRNGRHPASEPNAFAQWCNDRAEPFILFVIRKDQDEYGRLLSLIKKAKQ
jgi:hypothetical protein